MPRPLGLHRLPFGVDLTGHHAGLFGLEPRGLGLVVHLEALLP